MRSAPTLSRRFTPTAALRLRPAARVRGTSRCPRTAARFGECGRGAAVHRSVTSPQPPTILTSSPTPGVPFSADDVRSRPTVALEGTNGEILSWEVAPHRSFRIDPDRHWRLAFLRG